MSPRRPAKAAQPIAALAPENLPYQMFLLVQQMTREFQTILEPHGLTPLHWGVLCCLWREDNLRITEITQRLEQLGGTITVGLDAMQRRGLIERRSDETDRRVSRIALTRRGRSLQHVLEPAARLLIEAIFAGQTEEQHRLFAGQVERLRRGMAARGSVGQPSRIASQGYKNEVKTP